jgi:RNA polymerase sigma factor (sigma-70 family)
MVTLETATTDSALEAMAADMDVVQLVASASEGTNWAWNELVRRYSALIRAIARNHRLNDADAAEVAQITWMKLVENIDRIEKPERVNAWIATTTRRECLRVLRLSKRTQPLPLEDLLHASSDVSEVPEDIPVTAERDAALRLAYDCLPARCRRLLSLLTGDASMSYKKLSVVMNMKIGSIGPTRGRCLDRLRQIAEEYGIESAWG